MGDKPDSTFEREREIFFAALEKKTEESRAAYLEETCGEDAAMLGRVREMLENHSDDETETFLTPRDIPQMPGALMEGEGDMIGNYKLVEKLGEGGFGVVWMAEQEEPVQRKVALKLIKPGMDSAEVIARFGAERQALAVMDHPNIAKVFDAGATESGRPYFVMELSDGVPITEFCDREKLTTKARLELFATVCGAVQHAHQKAVIHRDLKPSNILVVDGDDGPVPKVIDFGIAKAIGEDVGAQTAFTAHGQLVGTPQYMSPEQAGMGASADIDTRSDVYSLGVVLYELLAGSPPFDVETLRSAGFEGMCRIIREDEPPRPSIRLGTASGDDSTRITGTRGVETQKLSRQVRGELDWIVMKAIEKDRGRRYETASAFAADIGRYLADEPVSAGPPSAAYRFKKFARRNKAVLGTAALVAFVLVAATVISVIFAIQADHAQKNEQIAKDDAIARGEETAIALEKSRYEEAKAWLERAHLHQSENNHFAAAMMAAKALGFRGFGAERQPEEFRKQHPVLLGEEKPEFEELVKIARAGEGFARPVWQIPISANHDNTVIEVAFSPDGKLLASCEASRSTFVQIIRLWNLATGKELRSIELVTMTNSLAFSPDGAILAIGGGDAQLGINSMLGLFDVATGNEIRYLKGHILGVRRVAFSPDGKTLASESYDGTSRLWDVATGNEIDFSPWHKSGVNSVAFNPDGRTLASGSEDGTASLWDFATRKELRSLEGHQSGILCLAFSPDGKILASGGDSRTFKLWDLASGKELRSIDEHLGRVISLAFSPDGKTLASGSGDGSAKLWDVATGKGLRTLKFKYSEAIRSMAFSPDGKTVACRYRRDEGNSFDFDLGKVTIWDVATGKEIDYLGGHQGGVNSIAFSPDGKILARVSVEGSAKLWDVSTGNELQSPETDRSEVNSVAFSPDGKTLAIGGDDGTIKLWDVATGKELRSIQGHQREILCVAFSPDGKTLASGSGDGPAKLWDVATGKGLRSIQGHQREILCVAFSPDGKALASGSDETVKLWDVATGNELRSLEGNIRSVAFSPDGATIACAANWVETVETVETVKLWDVSTGKELRSLGGHLGKVNSVAFSPDGKTLASGGDDKTVKLWDVSTGKELQSIQGHQREILCVAFSPDGKTIASGSDDDTVKLWKVSSGERAVGPGTPLAFGPDGTVLACDSDGTISFLDVSTGKELLQIPHSLPGSGFFVGGNSDAIRSVAFSPDGKTLASAGDDKTVKLWDVSTGKELQSLEAHQYETSCIAYGPDGAMLASGGILASGADDSDKAMIKLWDVATGKELRTLGGNSDAIRSMVFSPDGETLASVDIEGWDGDPDGLGWASNIRSYIRLWNVSTGKEIRSIERHGGIIVCVDFSPDGKTLATGGNDGSNGMIELWDVAGGRKLRSLEYHKSGLTVVWRVAFSPNGKTLASTAEGEHWRTKIWDVSTGEELRSVDAAGDSVLSPDQKTLASDDSPGGTLLKSLDQPPLNLAAYLDAVNPWCKLEGSQIEWTTTTGDLTKNLEFEFVNIPPDSHLEILRSARSEEEKNRALFWNYLHAENWNSAKLLYARLTDPEAKEPAREMMIIKRAKKARSAFDEGLHDHARWHLDEITSLLKPEESDAAMLKAKEKIEYLKKEIESVGDTAAPPGTGRVELPVPNPKTDQVEEPDYKFGIPVPNRPGMIRSPHAPEAGLIDARGLRPGMKIGCPFSNKVITVP